LVVVLNQDVTTDRNLSPPLVMKKTIVVSGEGLKTQSSHYNEKGANSIKESEKQSQLQSGRSRGQTGNPKLYSFNNQVD
jgi:hypothetical protein